MFCQNCGSELPDNATFCPECGMEQSGRNEQPNNQSNNQHQGYNQQPNNKPPKKSNSKTLIIVEAIVILVLIAGLIFALIYHKKQKDANEEAANEGAIVTTEQLTTEVTEAENTEDITTEQTASEATTEAEQTTEQSVALVTEGIDDGVHNGMLKYQFKDMTYYLSSDFSTDAVSIKDNGDHVDFYQTASLNDGGWLFTITVYDSISFVDNPSYEIIGRTADYYYVIEYPTDVQFAEAAQAEYAKLAVTEASQLNASIANAIYTGNKYYENGQMLYPDSNSRNLTMDEIKYLSKFDLMVARNEIFARHGYIFKDVDLNVYFANRSWYNGTVDATTFDDSSLNSYEQANIALIKQCEVDKGYK